MMRVEGLRAGYGRIEVLHGVSLSVEPGRPLVVFGANGAGKTTLCRAVSGLIPAWAGTIRLDGQDLTAASPAERVRRGIAQVPEGRQVFPLMTVEENLRLGGYVHGTPSRAEFGSVFSTFPILAERRRQAAGLLSGGEQQMLALARALMARPRLLLLDEPSQGLAPRAVEQVGAAVRAISAQGVAIVLVEQNLMLAEMIAEEAVVLETGTCVANGGARAMLASGAIEASYLGKDQMT